MSGSTYTVDFDKHEISGGAIIAVNKFLTASFDDNGCLVVYYPDGHKITTSQVVWKDDWEARDLEITHVS